MKIKQGGTLAGLSISNLSGWCFMKFIAFSIENHSFSWKSLYFQWKTINFNKNHCIFNRKQYIFIRIIVFSMENYTFSTIQQSIPSWWRIDLDRWAWWRSDLDRWAWWRIDLDRWTWWPWPPRPAPLWWWFNWKSLIFHWKDNNSINTYRYVSIRHGGGPYHHTMGGEPRLQGMGRVRYMM